MTSNVDNNLSRWMRGLATSGAALRAAQALLPGSNAVSYRSDTFTCTDPMLSDKLHQLVLAGQALSGASGDISDLDFEQTSKLHRFVLLVVTHLQESYPLRHTESSTN